MLVFLEVLTFSIGVGGRGMERSDFTRGVLGGRSSPSFNGAFALWDSLAIHGNLFFWVCLPSASGCSRANL